MQVNPAQPPLLDPALFAPALAPFGAPPALVPARDEVEPARPALAAPPEWSSSSRITS